jgi:hypothetical protein
MKPLNIRTLLKKPKNKLILILIAGLFIRLLISWQDVTLLVERIVLDDSFYGYKIAMNIASGNGLTYNGIDTTNGFQPLWVFIITPVFLFIKNIYLAVNVILTIETILDLVNIFLIYKLARLLFDERVALLSSLIWALNPLVMFQTLCGVDVTIYVIFVLASVYFYYKNCKRMGKNELVILGVLLGMTILSRMDGIFLLSVIAIHMFWKVRKNKIKKILCLASVSFLVTLPWFAWSFLEFGTILQSSGIASYYSSHGITPYYDLTQPTSIQDTLVMTAESFVRAFGSLAHQLGVVDFNVNAVTILLLSFFVLTFFWSARHWKKMLIPIVFSALLILFYAGYLWGIQIRYMTAIIPFLTIMIAAGFYEKINKTRLKISFTFFLTLVIILILFNGVQQWERGYFVWQKELYKDAIWVSENTPEDAVVGGFASGISLYFSNRTLINLDGVLNFDAIDAILNRSIYQYMKSRNITYWIESSYHNQTFVERYRNGEEIDIINENQWSAVMGEGIENIELIDVRYGIYKHIIGFEMLIAFIKAEVN